MALYILRTYEHVTIVAYDCSFWRMQCCHKGTVSAYDSLANEAVEPKDASDLIIFITTSNRMQ